MNGSCGWHSNWASVAACKSLEEIPEASLLHSYNTGLERCIHHFPEIYKIKLEGGCVYLHRPGPCMQTFGRLEKLMLLKPLVYTYITLQPNLLKITLPCNHSHNWDWNPGCLYERRQSYHYTIQPLYLSTVYMHTNKNFMSVNAAVFLLFLLLSFPLQSHVCTQRQTMLFFFMLHFILCANFLLLQFFSFSFPLLISC